MADGESAEQSSHLVDTEWNGTQGVPLEHKKANQNSIYHKTNCVKLMFLIKIRSSSNVNIFEKVAHW